MTMRNAWALCLLGAASLAACQPSDPPLTTSSSAQAAAAPETLLGQYRVAGIDGQEVQGGIGLALTVDENVVWFDPRCAGFSWAYSYSGGELTLNRPEKARREGGPYVAGPSRPVCRIAVHPEQQRLADALDAVDAVRRLPSGAVELSGGGRSITLFTQ